MSKHREEKINGEVMRELTAILRESKDPRISGMVSVLKVTVTKDLKYAKAYVSVFGGEKKKSEVAGGLASAKGFIRHEISARLSLRVTPEFEFIINDSLEEGDRILKIMKELG
jgi:ribosome-binding factor A